MTNYDMLVDSMSQVLYQDVYGTEWDETQARVTSRKLLEMVEEFQTKKVTHWRASD